MEPKFEVKLYGFNIMTSYLDEDKYPPVRPSDHNPPESTWVAGSMNWDLYSLSMIIFEWYMRKTKVIKTRDVETPLLQVKMKKKEIKNYPTVV